MTQSNKPHDDRPREGATTLPGGFIGLYAALTKKGWSQSADANGDNDKKVSKRSKTVEVQRMILEKRCAGGNTGVTKIQIIMALQDGKVKCQMLTEPFIPHFYKISIKDMGNLQFLIQEIDDYYDQFNASPEIRDITQDTRENMKTTQRLVRGEDGVLRVAKD